MRVKDDRQTFLGTWLRLAVLGEELAIFGDGSQRRDFTYVDDAVEAFLLAGARPEADGEIFNLGGEPPISLLDLAELLVEPRRRRRRTALVPFPEERASIDIGDYFADDSKIRATARLGARGRRCATGLERSLDYYREHAGAYW